MSACKYWPSTSQVATSLPLFASMAREMYSASMDTVGGNESSLDM